ncbi:MAG: 4Fe-4S dicluster domain-containing protein [Clostridiales Family XIII bacterium]|jgi:2-oxoglutarate ferredoxin oxidoreductase subunit delta|nr:4Fe-4S dicluster domain-containing protein [Clostridiales Family XIII bacterium]
MTKKFVRIDEAKCKGCNLCVSVCPKDKLISGKDTLNKAGYYAVTANDENICIGCLNCALMCPDGAISLYEE